MKLQEQELRPYSTNVNNKLDNNVKKAIQLTAYIKTQINKRPKSLTANI